MVPDGAIVLTYVIDLSRSYPLRNHILSHISVAYGQNGHILAQGSLGKGIYKHFEVLALCGSKRSIRPV